MQHNCNTPESVQHQRKPQHYKQLAEHWAVVRTVPTLKAHTLRTTSATLPLLMISLDHIVMSSLANAVSYAYRVCLKGAHSFNNLCHLAAANVSCVVGDGQDLVRRAHDLEKKGETQSFWLEESGFSLPA